MYRLKLICFVMLIAAAQASHLALTDAVAAMPYLRPTFMPRAADVRNYDLGFDKVFTDFYWLIFMQYVGDTKAREIDHYRDSEKYIDLIVGLDPHFINAYFFALFLIGGEDNNPRKAAALIERGLGANPDSWYLLYLAGLNQYLYDQNELKAAAYYRRAAKSQLAPKWLEHLAGVLESKAPPVVKKINVWENVYETSIDGAITSRAHRELIKMWLVVLNDSTPGLKERARKQLERLGVDCKRSRALINADF